MRSAECGVRSGECGVRSVAIIPHSAFRIPHWSVELLLQALHDIVMLFQERFEELRVAEE